MDSFDFLYWKLGAHFLSLKSKHFDNLLQSVNRDITSWCTADMRREYVRTMSNFSSELKALRHGLFWQRIFARNVGYRVLYINNPLAVQLKLWYFDLFFSTQRLFSINNIHKNWTLKSSLSYLKEQLKNRINYLSVFDSLASFLRYFSFFDMHITHMTQFMYDQWRIGECYIYLLL